MIGRSLAFCALVVSLGWPCAARAQTDVKLIPVVLSLTGQGAFLGKQQAEALAGLEKVVNEHGGVRGVHIHFDIVDDQTSPQVAVQLTNDILSHKPSAIIGSDVVAPCAAMAAIVKDAAVLYCTTPGFHPLIGSSTYSSGVSTFDILADAIRYYRRHGEKKIAVLTSTDATGQDIDRAVDRALQAPENHDVVITAHEHFGTGDLSVSAQMSRIKASDPQVLLGEATGPPFGTVLQGMSDVQLKIPVFTSTGNMVHAQLTQYAHFGIPDIMFVGVRFFEFDPHATAVPAVKQLYDALGATPPDIGHGLAWDAGLLIVSAYQKLGIDASADQVKAYINGLRNFSGACGTYDFVTTPQRGLGESAGIMMRWDPTAKTFMSLSKPGGLPL